MEIQIKDQSKGINFKIFKKQENKVLLTTTPIISATIIPLTSKKIRLIELLAKNKNTIVSNEQICMYVWNEMKSNSTLRSLVHRFRSVINDDIITNVNGVGYSISS